MTGFELLLYIFAIYGLIQFIMKSFYFKIDKKKRISYISLETNDTADVQEAVRELIGRAYWEIDEKHNKIIVFSLSEDGQTDKLLEVLHKQYPEIQIFKDSI